MKKIVANSWAFVLKENLLLAHHNTNYHELPINYLINRKN